MNNQRPSERQSEKKQQQKIIIIKGEDKGGMEVMKRYIRQSTRENTVGTEEKGRK